jgi:hypothetical protein
MARQASSVGQGVLQSAPRTTVSKPAFMLGGHSALSLPPSSAVSRSVVQGGPSRGEERKTCFYFHLPFSLLPPPSSLPVLLPPLSRWSHALKVGQHLREAPRVRERLQAQRLAL